MVFICIPYNSVVVMLAAIQIFFYFFYDVGCILVLEV